MAAPKNIQIPFQNALVDAKGIVTSSWTAIFKLIYDFFLYFGEERSATILNNQTAVQLVDRLTFDSRFFSQAVVEYLIQRTSNSSELVESGILLFSYSPEADQWRMTSVSENSPDDAGITFSLTPKSITATYDHTTALWTSASLKIPVGAKIKLASSGTLPTGYSSALNYYVINGTGSTFQLSVAPGGSPVAAAVNSGTGTITVTVQDRFLNQLSYISSNQAGTGKISRMVYRKRIIAAKSQSYSVARDGGVI